jgi:hypothetical protein
MAGLIATGDRRFFRLGIHLDQTATVAADIGKTFAGKPRFKRKSPAEGAGDSFTVFPLYRGGPGF